MLIVTVLRPLSDDLLNAPVDAVRLVDIPPAHVLMVDGIGNPESSAAFREAIGKLYGVTYTLRFGLRRAGLDPGPMPPLEGLWRSEDMPILSGQRDAGAIHWTLLMHLPEMASADAVHAALEDLARKRGPDAITGLRVERFEEGRCAQITHLGPYDTEEATIGRLLRFIEEHQLRPTGRHHEVYLSDPRRTRPERVRTLLRQPVTPG